MLQLKNINNFQDAIEQLGTVEDEINENNTFAPLTIASTLAKCNPLMLAKPEFKMIVSGIYDMDIIPSLEMVKHYFTDETQIDILLTNISSPFETIENERVRIATTEESIETTLDNFREQNNEINCVFLFNLDDDKLSESLAKNHYQLYLKKRQTKVFVCHNSTEDEIKRLILLKKYNINELATIKNNFSHGPGSAKTAALISSLDFRHATRNVGYVDSEATIMKMLRNRYFDPRFNSFGLHYIANIDDKERNVIFFDYELCYCPELFNVYLVNDGNFTIAHNTPEDPFPIFTRELKKESYIVDSEDPYIPLKHKESAAKLRLHFNSLIKQRIDNFNESATTLLKEANVPNSKEALKLAVHGVSNGHSLRDVTSTDHLAFQMLHHSPLDFIQYVKEHKEAYTASDIRGDKLIFEIVRSEQLHDQVVDFFFQIENLKFDLYELDSDGYTILDNAISTRAFKNAEFLIKKGFNINYANPFGFTALHRAYAENNDMGISLLIQRGAKQLPNVFGHLPKDLMETEIENEDEDEGESEENVA